MSPSDFINVVVLDDYSTVWGMPNWVCWILIGIFLIVSGLFSASENAFSNCNKYHYKVLAEEGNKKAKRIVFLVEKFDNTLITVLVGNNIVQTLMSFLSAILFYNIVHIFNLAEGIEAIFSTVVVGLLVYIISDTIPKIISKQIPDRICEILVYPILFIYYLFLPIRLIFAGIIKIVRMIFKIKDDSILTKEDFIIAADEAVSSESEEVAENKEEVEELLEPNEIKILKKAFSFDTIEANEVIKYKQEIYAIDINELTLDKLNEEILKVNYSRIPIYDKDLDNIIGILNVKTYFKEYNRDPHLEIRSILTKPLFFEKDTKVDVVFNAFNKEKQHMGIIVDNGKVIGIITMEEILEELVGELGEQSTILNEVNKL